MAKREVLTHHDLVLRPDPSRTVLKPFLPSDPEAFAQPGHSRGARIAERVLSLDPAQLRHQLELVVEALAERHRDLKDLLRQRFDDLKDDLGLPDTSEDQALLIAAYFTEEYSFESAALFNPSVIRVPDQDGCPDGAIRIGLSLRGIGEGHVSSVTFRSGLWTPGGEIAIDPPSAYAVSPRIDAHVDQSDDAVVRLECMGSREISETVLFPVLPRHRQGIEDARFVEFTEEDGSIHYYATATAFSGSKTTGELIVGEDLNTFTLHPLRGKSAAGKGMALFPRRIDGRYVMLGRQDNENIWLLSSDDLFTWGDGTKIVTPQWPWEFVQMGNCGSPIEIDEGWLVMTHGVGAGRTYCIGACLLDKADPGKLLARAREPLLFPSPDERDGYVPNVVYSCGSIVAGRQLLLPYAVADSFTKFATGTVDDVLAAMD